MRALLFLLLSGAHCDWRNQYPDTWQEDIQYHAGTFDSFRYWYSYSKSRLEFDENAYQSCREVIGFPPTARFTFHQAGSGSTYPPSSREFTLVPKASSQEPLDTMSKCCRTSCGGKLARRRLVDLEIGYEWQKTRYDWKTKIVHRESCLMCRRSDASPRNCSNGQYASAYLSIDDEGVVTNPIQCQPCPPGTWMTCIEKSSCTWPIPTSRDAYNPGLDFWNVKDYNGKYIVPVGTCLPCEKAGSSKSHHGDDPAKASFIEAVPSNAFISTAPAERTEGLPWRCPGGDLSPSMCTIPNTQGDPLTSDKCVCRAGLFLNTQNLCDPCPKGHRCPRGFADPCPDHTHQPAQGQSECYNCTSDGTERGAPMAYCGPGSQLRKCTGVYKAANMQCVNCNQCRKMYLTNNAEGKVDCYN